MQPYQEEYIANLKDITVPAGKGAVPSSFGEWMTWMERHKKAADEKAERNMKLLREELFPVLDHIFEAEEEEISQLGEFAGHLLAGREELDVGLYCQIHKALLNLARRTKNREVMIRELYLLGMGYYSLCNKLVGMEYAVSRKYISQMRLCFTEAGAYLKYFDEIEDTETRGFILRSRANMALGQFPAPGEKIHMVKRTLQILQDKGYQEKEPGLPWDRYIYMTHQQMAASISYTRELTMTSRDIEDVMESVYIVYQRRLKEAAEKNGKPPARPAFAYCAIEYYCGMYDINELLTRMEALMDDADPSDFSADGGMYSIISLPAFYCQFLNFFPELIPEREEYVESLYRKVLAYVESFPKASENESLFVYLRQLSATFVETKNSITYKEFLIRLEIHFAPAVYVHCRAVGTAAAVLGDLILEEEPGYFDDIPDIRQIKDRQKKRRKVREYAMECGLLYDVGKISFMNLYSQASRQWFEEEYELAHLHTQLGAEWLSGRKSTEGYAPVALGHHSWYDGSRGYPEVYHRLECPCRQMVDLIGLLDWMNNVTETARLYTGLHKNFEEAVEEAVALEGRRFSPLLTARLRDKKVTGKLRDAFAEGRREAYRQLYEWRERG